MKWQKIEENFIVATIESLEEVPLVKKVLNISEEEANDPEESYKDNLCVGGEWVFDEKDLKKGYELGLRINGAPAIFGYKKDHVAILTYDRDELIVPIKDLSLVHSYNVGEYYIRVGNRDGVRITSIEYARLKKLLTGNLIVS